MGFDSTRWSIVLQARTADADGARGALDVLCRTYRSPVIGYIRRRGHDPDSAEDLAQEFFARFIGNALHARVDPARGRFRTFLLIALRRFLMDMESEVRAVKRGHGLHFVALDANAAQDANNAIAYADSPEQAFDRDWALALLHSALTRLREEAERTGKLRLFQALEDFIAEPPDRAEYQRVAATLHLSPNAIAVAVHRLRQRLRDLVRDEMSHTARDAGELETEMDDLSHALSGSGRRAENSDPRCLVRAPPQQAAHPN